MMGSGAGGGGLAASDGYTGGSDGCLSLAARKQSPLPPKFGEYKTSLQHIRSEFENLSIRGLCNTFLSLYDPYHLNYRLHSVLKVERGGG